MANFKNSLNPPKAISFQIQLYCLSFDMFWVATLSYCIVAPTIFAQISLLFIVESAFYSFFAPAFRAFKFFIHTLILHHISDFSNAISSLDLKKLSYNATIKIEIPPVAQLDSATDSDSGGRGFKSLRAGQFVKRPMF